MEKSITWQLFMQSMNQSRQMASIGINMFPLLFVSAMFFQLGETVQNIDWSRCVAVFEVFAPKVVCGGLLLVPASLSCL